MTLQQIETRTLVYIKEMNDRRSPWLQRFQINLDVKENVLSARNKAPVAQIKNAPVIQQHEISTEEQRVAVNAFQAGLSMSGKDAVLAAKFIIQRQMALHKPYISIAEDYASRILSSMPQVSSYFLKQTIENSLLKARMAENERETNTLVKAFAPKLGVEPDLVQSIYNSKLASAVRAHRAADTQDLLADSFCEASMIDGVRQVVADAEKANLSEQQQLDVAQTFIEHYNPSVAELREDNSLLFASALSDAPQILNVPIAPKPPVNVPVAPVNVPVAPEPPVNVLVAPKPPGNVPVAPKPPGNIPVAPKPPGIVSGVPKLPKPAVQPAAPNLLEQIRAGTQLKKMVQIPKEPKDEEPSLVQKLVSQMRPYLVEEGTPEEDDEPWF